MDKGLKGSLRLKGLKVKRVRVKQPRTLKTLKPFKH